MKFFKDISVDPEDTTQYLYGGGGIINIAFLGISIGIKTYTLNISSLSYRLIQREFSSSYLVLDFGYF